MSNTETSSTTMDNLFGGVEYPVITEAVTVATSQTLARGAAVGKKLYGALTAAAGTNTGNGTCTALATVGGTGAPKPIIGAYVLTCIAAVTHGGVWKLVDPNGSLVSGYLAMTASTGAATVFEVGGITFTLTDGSTDFAAGDVFTLTLAAGTGQVVILNKANVDGSQDIYGIMLEAVTTSGSTATGVVAKTGYFNSDALSFYSGTTAADVAADARTKGIFFVDGVF